MEKFTELAEKNRANFPLFLKKSWYSKKMKELNSIKISSEDRLIYEFAWARIAATAMQDEIDVKRWKEKIREEVIEELGKGAIQKLREEVTTKVKKELIEKLLKMNVAVEIIAVANNVTTDFVLDIKAKMQ
jgi:hypothetical protein